MTAFLSYFGQSCKVGPENFQNQNKVETRKIREFSETRSNVSENKDDLTNFSWISEKMLHFLQNADKLSIQSSLTNVKSAGPPLNRNYVAVILDEVALEGLDGITIPMLKYRLSKRSGSGCGTFNSDFLLDILKELIQKAKVQAFILPSPRPFRQPVNMADLIDAEGVLQDPEGDVPDSYPFLVVSDDKEGVMGSCSTFYDRKLVANLDQVHDEDSIGKTFKIPTLFIFTLQFDELFWSNELKNLTPFILTNFSYSFCCQSKRTGNDIIWH